MAIGFSKDGKYLLTLSHSGRGLYMTQTWERIARCPQTVYPTDGKIPGIGPLDGQMIEVKERNEFNEKIEIVSPDGMIQLIGESDGITIL